MSYVLVKLTNRDDIVGILESENDKDVIIKDPLILVIKGDSADEAGAILLSYIPFSSKDYITVNKLNVISVVPLNEDMARYYTASKIYCERTFDKAFTSNLRKSTEYLERFLFKNKQERKPKQDVKNDVINLFMSPAASNTVN
jgi:hypothetical protein